MAKSNEKVKEQVKELFIPKPKFRVIPFKIVGVAPLVGNKFSTKALATMKEAMEAGGQGKSSRKREPKDFKAAYNESIHWSEQGWAGHPCAAFRNAMISACRTCGVVMTRAKLSAFVEEDGFDRDDGTPLIEIKTKKPKYAEHFVSNATGVCDLRPRPMWDAGWTATIRIRFDEEMLSPESVGNLLLRAGLQVGVGAGRPDSKNSNGMGWGLFEIAK